MQLTKDILIEYLGFLGVKEESIISIAKGKWCWYVSIKKDPYLFDSVNDIDKLPYIIQALDKTFSVTPEKWMKKGCYEFRVSAGSRHPVMEYGDVKDLFLHLKKIGFHIDPLMIEDDGYVLRIKTMIDDSAVDLEYRVNQLKELEKDIRDRGWGYRMNELSANSYEFIISYRCHLDSGFGRAANETV